MGWLRVTADSMIATILRQAPADRRASIAAWRDDFAAPAVPDAPDAATDDGWREQWLDTLERTSAVGATDDRAIVRDNRPFGYPTLSLLVCTASVAPGAVDVRYGEFDEPGAWNRPVLR